MKNNAASRTKSKKLSTRIALISGCILIAVFTLLITFTVISSRSALGSAIGGEFKALAQTTAQKVQQIIDTAESAGTSIQAYLNRAYDMSAKGKRNLLGQDYRVGETADSVIRNRSFVSTIYNVAISEMSSDVEKYMIETARNTANGSADIWGVGVLFEPYAFDAAIRDYAFYITETDGDKAVVPYGTYEEYSQQDVFKKAAEAKKMVYIDPYEYNGTTMVTASLPVYYDGKLRCVVIVDIKVSNFAKAAEENTAYPSMFTTIVNQNNLIVYDTETAENVGMNLSSFFEAPEDLAAMQTGIAGKQYFRNTTYNGGELTECFFYPISAGDQCWWSLTALTRSDMDKTVVISTIWQILISIVALVIVAGSIVILLRRTLRPINGLVHVAESIAEGNLDVRFESKSNDEIGKLSEAFAVTVGRLKAIIGDVNDLLSSMADGNFNVRSRTEESYVGEYRNLLLSVSRINTTLSDTLSQINQASEQVSSGSGQVSSGAQALSQGATEQASAVEELAATINEISVQVNSNAENARAASNRASAVGDEIVESNRQMEEMISAMGDISQSSNEIGKIIKAIEDIAFQTNILALNAAVEAARAGAAGKGFAVVADEVRSLAAKSAESSKSTAVLIERSVRAVENGTRIADETAKSLLSVVDSAKEVAATVDKISVASSEQASSIAQVTQGVDQISSVVQTNSATAEESAAASEELSGQAQMLKELVGQFRLKNSEGTMNPTPAQLSVSHSAPNLPFGPGSANDY